MSCVAPSADAGGDPVCGCDGKAYPSRRAAQLAGTDISWGACPPPSSGYFQCGYKFCRYGQGYCLAVRDECYVATAAYCLPLPSGCDAGDPCACFGDAHFCDAYDQTGDPAPLCEIGPSGEVSVRCIY